MNILEFAAKDNETAQQDPAPIPHILGVVTGVQLKVAKVEWDEATDAAIQQDLEEVYKPKGLAGIQEFVTDFGERQGYKLIKVAHETADKMMQGAFKTIDELKRYEEQVTDFNGASGIHILYSKKPNPNDGDDIEIIETIILEH